MFLPSKKLTLSSHSISCHASRIQAMASGIAHRRTKPALAKLNTYSGFLYPRSKWESSREHGRISQYNTVKKSRRKFVGPAHPAQPDKQSVIPLEVTHEILLELDIESLGNMRQLNSHFQTTVESLPAYRLLLLARLCG